MVNLELKYNDLKNKAYYIFGKGGIKKDGHGVVARMRPSVSNAIMRVQKRNLQAVSLDL